ncbi:MAG: hypothetical protein F6K40_03015 [Okeania sp. SIO3I5]|uniref:hypothetical protein n=1 Tax=Okeania sp. SIO3I5 TaxID=2607805 RepID=UPI0013B9FEF8|nr:hypothetical protein [Okeania sp. SIO3I5]NEQ35333.1 hypothetical protein [Okeania sp. SIO3I5]
MERFDARKNQHISLRKAPEDEDISGIALPKKIPEYSIVSYQGNLADFFWVALRK